VRVATDRSASPSEAIVDSQSVRGDGQQAVGYDAGKQIKGRKRFLTVDTLGLILRVYVMAAVWGEREGQTSSPTSSDGKRSISAAYHLGRWWV